MFLPQPPGVTALCAAKSRCPSHCPVCPCVPFLPPGNPPSFSGEPTRLSPTPYASFSSSVCPLDTGVSRDPIRVPLSTLLLEFSHPLTVSPEGSRIITYNPDLFPAGRVPGPLASARPQLESSSFPHIPAPPPGSLSPGTAGNSVDLQNSIDPDPTRRIQVL